MVCIRLTPVAELRAGFPRRPHRGTAAAATDEASEGAKCGRRDAKQLHFHVPANGPRVSSSAKLGRFQAPCSLRLTTVRESLNRADAIAWNQDSISAERRRFAS